MNTYATFNEEGTFLGFCKCDVHQRKPTNQIWVMLEGDIDPLLHTWEGTLADGKVTNLIKKSIYDERTKVYVESEIELLRDNLSEIFEADADVIRRHFDHLIKRLHSFSNNPNVDMIGIGKDQEYLDEIFYRNNNVNA